jgi:hypothetical protein
MRSFVARGELLALIDTGLLSFEALVWNGVPQEVGVGVILV